LCCLPQAHDFDKLLERVHLDQCLSVVNARSFMEDLKTCSKTADKMSRVSECPGDRLNRADLLLEQVELADLVVLTHSYNMAAEVIIIIRQDKRV
jgi:G3E family GTPase